LTSAQRPAGRLFALKDRCASLVGDVYANARVCGRSSSGSTGPCFLAASPVSVQTSLDQPLGRRVNFFDMAVRDQAQQDKSYLGVFVGTLTELGIGEERVKNTQICMP
jgi:hypothetical protein